MNNVATTINAPYLRTTHTWSCPKGHTVTVHDDGWPQRPAVKQAVLRAWQAHGGTEEPRCPVCGSHVKFFPSTEPAVGPGPAPHVCPEAPSLKAHGAAFYAVPRYSGGFAEFRATANRKLRGGGS